MKLLFLSSMILMFLKKMKMFMIIIPLLMMMMITKMLNNKMMMMNMMFSLDQLSIIMIMLSLISIILILFSSNSFKEIIYMMYFILMILIMTFSFNNIFNFYITFELVLIPTMMLIMKLGNQSERLQAGIYLIVYTILASLPLLINIILLKNNMSFMLMYMMLMKFNFPLFFMLAFLIKTPMFFMHLWLPKAHVEAPLEGSMILASVLLKLGGYGLIRMMPMSIHKTNPINSWVISISMIGAIITSMNCIRQKDLKSLIAYSSVAHMGLVLSSIFTFNNIGLSGAIIMMIAHGLSSSALFLLVNDIYIKTHSRNIIMFSGLFSITPNIIFWWFLLMAINISAPPSINTISEIYIMSSLIMWSKNTIIIIMFTSLMIISFSLSMFINISHNKNEMMYFNFSKQKTFLSLFIHLIPLIILLMKLESMYLY